MSFFTFSISALPPEVTLEMSPHFFKVGPAIWGLQNRAKGPKYFWKKGYFGPKTGPQKPGVKEFFDVGEHFTVKNGRFQESSVLYLRVFLPRYS